MSATSKTFNVAACIAAMSSSTTLRCAPPTRNGCRKLSISPNLRRRRMTPASSSPGGRGGLGRRPVRLSRRQPPHLRRGHQRDSRAQRPADAGTYLSWVDFAGTGMTPEEVNRRVTTDARTPRTLGRASERAAKPSCDPTSAPSAPASKRPSPAWLTRSATCSDARPRLPAQRPFLLFSAIPGVRGWNPRPFASVPRAGAKPSGAADSPPARSHRGHSRSAPGPRRRWNASSGRSALRPRPRRR